MTKKLQDILEQLAVLNAKIDAMLVDKRVTCDSIKLHTLRYDRNKLMSSLAYRRHVNAKK